MRLIAAPASDGRDPPDEVFARHAPDIAAGFGSARSMTLPHGHDERSPALITAPCVGAALLPDVLVRVTRERLLVRVTRERPGLRI